MPRSSYSLRVEKAKPHNLARAPCIEAMLRGNEAAAGRHKPDMKSKRLRLGMQDRITLEGPLPPNYVQAFKCFSFNYYICYDQLSCFQEISKIKSHGLNLELNHTVRV